RLSHVAQQLRGYLRGGAEAGHVQPVDLRAILHEAIALAALGREGLPVVHCDVPALPRVAGAAELLSQAFVNVFSNAFDAVTSVPDPHVWVEGGLAEAGVAGESPRAVEVRIRDNGTGIGEPNRERVFEPFFTTKSHGAGLGLGLVIAREVVENHGGTIEL